MSYRELLEALEKECQEKIGKIRDEEEAEAERIRVGADRHLRKLEEEYELGLSSAARAGAEAVLSEAERTARAKRLTAEKELSERLYQFAVRALPCLRDEKYGDVFGVLVGELPSFCWEVVRVRAEDGDMAKAFFPGAEIAPDDGISGGLDVIAGKGTIRVVNTFEKRLEKAWSGMLPGIMNDVYDFLGTAPDKGGRPARNPGEVDAV
ncbi:MAG: V-type ATP synthase subunit E [Nitrospirae bacterium]|nr:V-type ATP synthase subunit E [Nitrospirota bacterium]